MYAPLKARNSQNINSKEVVKPAKEKKIKELIMNTLSGMTIGLFATLIIGTIFEQFASLIGNNWVGNFLNDGIAKVLKAAMGIGIGIGIGISMKQSSLKLIVSGMMGGIATSFKLQFVNNANPLYQPVIGLNLDPLTTYLVVLLAVLLLNLILRKQTPIDILLIPFLGALIAFVLTYLISGPIGYFIYYLSQFINLATTALPLVMVIVISVSMGMILTAPISSAAIAYLITLGANPVAAAAAIIGTSTQMVGFAIQSRKDNPIGVVLSVFFGTSMLQFKNIIKKPTIWLPTIISSAILAPFVLLFKLPFSVETGVIQNAWTLGAGMGTSGLVGQISTIQAMGYNNLMTWIFIVSLQIVGPILLVYLIDLMFRKFKWIKAGDFSL